MSAPGAIADHLQSGEGADLHDANLQVAILHGANLQGAILSDANFKGATTIA